MLPIGELEQKLTDHENFMICRPAPGQLFYRNEVIPHLLSHLTKSHAFNPSKKIAPFQRLFFHFHFTRGKMGK